MSWYAEGRGDLHARHTTRSFPCAWASVPRATEAHEQGPRAAGSTRACAASAASRRSGRATRVRRRLRAGASRCASLAPQRARARLALHRVARDCTQSTASAFPLGRNDRRRHGLQLTSPRSRKAAEIRVGQLFGAIDNKTTRGRAHLQAKRAKKLRLLLVLLGTSHFVREEAATARTRQIAVMLNAHRCHPASKPQRPCMRSPSARMARTSSAFSWSTMQIVRAASYSFQPNTFDPNASRNSVSGK